MKRITYKHSVKSIQRVWLVQCHKIFNFLNVCKFCNQIWIFKWVVLNHLKNLFLNNPFTFLDRKKICSNHSHNLLYWKQCTLAKLQVKKFPGKGLRNLNYGCIKNETSLSTELVSIFCILKHTVYALHPLLNWKCP